MLCFINNNELIKQTGKTCLAVLGVKSMIIKLFIFRYADAASGGWYHAGAGVAQRHAGE